jgi:hypothetical protein
MPQKGSAEKAIRDIRHETQDHQNAEGHIAVPEKDEPQDPLPVRSGSIGVEPFELDKVFDTRTIRHCAPRNGESENGSRL